MSHLSRLALLTSLLLMIWWITRFCFSDCSYPVAFLLFPFFGLNHTSLTARRWLSMETPGLRGLGLNLVFPSARCSDPSFTFSLLPTSRFYFLNTCRANGHLYADDTQPFVHGLSCDQLSLVRSIDCLVSDLHNWMSTYRLCLKATKTQL